MNLYRVFYTLVRVRTNVGWTSIGTEFNIALVYRYPVLIRVPNKASLWGSLGSFGT